MKVLRFTGFSLGVTLLGACLVVSSSRAASEPAPPAPTTTRHPAGHTSPPAGPAKVIRVGYLPATHDALLFVASDLGLFDRTSVDVQMRSYDNSVQILSDLKSGILDIGIPGIASPANEIAGHAPLSIIGGAASKSAALVAPPPFAAELEKAKTVNEKLRMLVGRRVGAVRGSTGLAIFQQGLRSAGIDVKNVNLREFTKPPDIVTALTTNGLDAGLLWSPHMTLAEAKQQKIVLWMSDILPDHVCCRQIANDSFVSQNRDATAGYLLGILKADQQMRRARRDPSLQQRLFAAVRRFLPTLSDEQLRTELFAAEPRTTVSSGLKTAGIRRYLDAMKDSGFLKEEQCRHVASKIDSAPLLEAYRRLGCTPEQAAKCLEGDDRGCSCLE